MWETIFDRIADDYDQQVQEADQRNLFPFAGYDEVLTTIARYILSNKLESTLKILDLGIGTARFTGNCHQKESGCLARTSPRRCSSGQDCLYPRRDSRSTISLAVFPDRL